MDIHVAAGERGTKVYQSTFEQIGKVQEIDTLLTCAWVQAVIRIVASYVTASPFAYANRASPQSSVCARPKAFSTLMHQSKGTS